MQERESLLRRAGKHLGRKTPLLPGRELIGFVRPFLERREVFLDAAASHGSPLYVIEPEVLKERIRTFNQTFEKHIPGIRSFYAMKSNAHPAIVSGAVECGMGLDASSGEELSAALECDPGAIIFSGPGKTTEELALAATHAEKVTVMLDSFGELGRLEHAASAAGGKVTAGVRLMAQEKGLWRKFGIELGRLEEFLDVAGSCRRVQVRGIQFHTSWNLTPAAQTRFIGRLGRTLTKLDLKKRKSLKFVDIGGGFWPERGEWLHPCATTEGRLAAAIDGAYNFPRLEHHRLKSTPIEVFARRIGAQIEHSLRPLIDCAIYAEPGRWICNDAMHVLIRVVDVKGADLVICDAGTNTVGWERFESDYFPLLNLSRPALDEHRCRVLGSLCTPHDVWGYAYFGEGIEEGDLLLVPAQGAYTWGLRQRFIKPLPRSVLIDAAGHAASWS